MGISPKYGIGDRVNLPFAADTQALIVALSGRQGDVFNYVIRYTSQTGLVVDTTVSEGQIVIANPASETVPHLKSEIAALNSKAITMRGTIEALERKVARKTQRKRR